jgi:hypothetical protein
VKSKGPSRARSFKNAPTSGAMVVIGVQKQEDCQNGGKSGSLKVTPFSSSFFILCILAKYDNDDTVIFFHSKRKRKKQKMMSMKKNDNK